MSGRSPEPEGPTSFVRGLSNAYSKRKVLAWIGRTRPVTQRGASFASIDGTRAVDVIGKKEEGSCD